MTLAPNVQKLAERLRQLDQGTRNVEFAKLFWKPKEGPQVVRIVPNLCNTDSPIAPFVELKFYYKIDGNNYLAPCTFGKPDPVIELVEDLMKNGSQEDKITAEKLAPVTRTYAPILVRGEEELGVRYWGFGTQVYKQLLNFMTKPAMWGDITSFTDGNDLEVEFRKVGKKKNKKGEPLPETIITPYPKKTPVVDPSRKDLMEKVKNQTDITKIFPLKSYEELKNILNKWIDPTSNPETSGEPKTFDETAAEQSGNKEDKAQTPTPNPTGATGEDFEKFFTQK